MQLAKDQNLVYSDCDS